MTREVYEEETYDNKAATHALVHSMLYVETLEQRIAELEAPKTCNGCSYDYFGCSVQDSILKIEPNATFNTFCCNKYEPKVKL